MMVVDTQATCCQHILGIQYMAKLVMHKTKRKKKKRILPAADYQYFTGGFWRMLGPQLLKYFMCFFNGQLLEFITLHHYASLL